MSKLVSLVNVFALLSLLAVGGGTAVLPQMKHETVATHRWLSAEQFSSNVNIALRADFEALAQTDEGDLGVVSRGLADSKWIVAFTTPHRPIRYHVWHRESKSSEFLFSHLPELETYELAEARPIKYRARDGLEIHGFLTIPRGVDPRNLPLVLNPHGGPWARNYWEFDECTQLLALQRSVSASTHPALIMLAPTSAALLLLRKVPFLFRFLPFTMEVPQGWKCRSFHQLRLEAAAATDRPWPRERENLVGWAVTKSSASGVVLGAPHEKLCARFARSGSQWA